MADPQPTKVTAPIGSSFLLTWTTDAYAKVTHFFQLIDGTTKKVDGRKPKDNRPAKGEVKVFLSITKDGKPDGYRVNMPDPRDRELMKFEKSKAVYVHEYTFVFHARKTGDYQFTVSIPDAVPPIKITKDVTVVPAEPLNDRRKDMLALFDKWLPSSVMGDQKIPPGETKDILAKSNWDTSTKTWIMPPPIPKDAKAEKLPLSGKEEWEQSGSTITAKGQGQISCAKRSFNKHVLPGRKAAWAALSEADKAKNTKPAQIPIDTSCISVMSEFVKLWGNQFTADLNTMVKPDPTHYIKAADEFSKPDQRLPKPGDILYLGKENNRGEFQHVCILVSRSSEVWVTADGGGGALPDQTASVVEKPLSWTSSKPVVPSFMSVTDNKIKALHGWVDIDLVPNDKYNADGSRK